MRKDTDILRFIEAQDDPYANYDRALAEIKKGRKISHWIWYIFPQFRAFGHSKTALFYGIADKSEAERYLEHPVLNQRIHEISEALLEHSDKSANAIFGEHDAKKVRSCMTMFDYLSPNDVFAKVLDAFYGGVRGDRTIKELQKDEA